MRKAVMGSGTSHKFKKVKGKRILVKKNEISSSLTSSQKSPAIHPLPTCLFLNQVLAKRMGSPG